ncbi:MAG: ABC transporter ATP-binding protein [Thermoleophilia bacterium]
MSGAVVARGLVKRYGSRAAVDGIDLDVRPGECFGLLGPNGAGKSTTMRMLSCLTPRDGGTLLVLGLDPEREPRALKRMLGVVAQETTLDLELTVRENLLVFARYFDIPRRDAERRAAGLLRTMDLADRADDQVDRLSGGMRRRLQIGRALVNDPRLVLLDEPTTGLDPQARHVVWDRLRALRAAGATLLLTSHYMDEAERLCDRLAIIDRGRISRIGAPADLIAAETGREALELLVAPGDAARLLAALGAPAPVHRLDGDHLTLFGDDAEQLHERVRATGLPARRRTVRMAGLEDVFLALTGHRLDDEAER